MGADHPYLFTDPAKIPVVEAEAEPEPVQPSRTAQPTPTPTPTPKPAPRTNMRDVRDGNVLAKAAAQAGL